MTDGQPAGKQPTGSQPTGSQPTGSQAGSRQAGDRRSGDATTSALVDRLSAICGPGFTRPANDDDAVATVGPRWVVAPGTVGAVADVLRLSADRGLALVTRGSGSKLHWGSPPSHVDIVLETGRLCGVWHHPPGSTLVQVGAGTPVRAVQRTVGRTGLRIPMDPRSTSATVGGVVAADETGPLSHRHGPPGRHLVGVDYVDATGNLVRAAPGTDDGSELPQLLCGSQGALAVLVSTTVRLLPVPADRLWVRRQVHTPYEVRDLVGELVVAGLEPAAIELDLPGDVEPRTDPTAAGPPERHRQRPGLLAVLFEGTSEQIRRRAGRAAGLLAADASIAAQPPSWWRRYPFAAGDVAIQLDVPAAHLHSALYALRDAARTRVPVRGAVGTGLVHAALPGSTPPEQVDAILGAVRAVLRAHGGNCVVLDAPAPVRRAVDIWGEVPGLARLRELKQRFDPHRRLAPGRLTGGL
ncbi:FAD-binding oxidoreductase [Solwaraspora sp. WMMB335]|uniref:FAD-binding oxidoreductase n=1 Tax=Solwaraspora sp. WMMB335 TaxID=3404118 RepID=UPI003B923AF2